MLTVDLSGSAALQVPRSLKSRFKKVLQEGLLFLSFAFYELVIHFARPLLPLGDLDDYLFPLMRIAHRTRALT